RAQRKRRCAERLGRRSRRVATRLVGIPARRSALARVVDDRRREKVGAPSVDVVDRPQPARDRARSDERRGGLVMKDGRTDVAVVGGGMAGLTAALRLVERGYNVTLYEAKKSALGGNVSS